MPYRYSRKAPCLKGMYESKLKGRNFTLHKRLIRYCQQVMNYCNAKNIPKKSDKKMGEIKSKKKNCMDDTFQRVDKISIKPAVGTGKWVNEP